MPEQISPLTSWQASRRAELASPNSWQGLVGLFWLEPGENTVGGDMGMRVSLPGETGLLGHILWQQDALLWVPLNGDSQFLLTDRCDGPTMVNAGKHAFFIVERQGKLAARVRDLAWAEKTPPMNLDYFPESSAWRITARWQSIHPPISMEVPNVTGELQTVDVGFKAVFEYSGTLIELLPMSVKDDVFFVFRDRTSGRETYGAGRFLKAELPVNGEIVLDFNRAYNPPCAFTPFATCPLPPAENWLPFPVDAGEMKPKVASS